MEAQFELAMRGIYDAALNLNPPYRATIFLRMVNNHGGREAANRLLAAQNPAEGFTQLFLRNALELSVEYLILQDQWHTLFTDNQREIARIRLRAMNFNI